MVEVIRAGYRTFASLLGLFTEAPRKGPWRKYALSIVETKPAYYKSSVVVDVLIFTSERRGFDASAPSSTRA